MKRTAILGGGVVLIASSIVYGVQSYQNAAGYAALERGDISAAEEHFTAAGNVDGLGYCALALRDYASAHTAFSGTGNENGLALVDMGRRDFESARSRYQALGDRSGEGLCEMALGDYVRAEPLFVEAKDHNRLGDLYAKTGRFEMARAAFAEAGAQVKVVQAYRAEEGNPNRFADALEYGRRALSAFGADRPALLCELGDIAREMGETADAIELLDEVISGYPDWKARALARKARALFEAQEDGAAQETLIQLRDLDGAPPDLVADAVKGLSALQDRAKATIDEEIEL